MNLNDLILKVSSRISNQIDGDTVLLLEQSIPTSIRRVTKLISSNKPNGHEKLLTQQSVANASITTPTGTSYPRFDITDLTNAIVVDPTFHNLTLLEQTDDNNWRGHPVMAMPALGLASEHNRVCYYVEYPYVYIAYPSGVADIDVVKVTHYTYLSLTDFPIELEDYLIDDLVGLLNTEVQRKQIDGKE